MSDGMVDEKPDEYVTKSAVKDWTKCKRYFYYSRVKNIETEDIEAMKTGRDIHEIIEQYYKHVRSYCSNNDAEPEALIDFIAQVDKDWKKYIDPYITNFLGFESRRLSTAKEATSGDDNRTWQEGWLPVTVEESTWNSITETAPVISGYVDAIIPACSFKRIDRTDGYVVVDFKTGTKGNYSSHEEGGVLLDVGFYRMLFEDEYDIVGVCGYYPKNNEIILEKTESDRKEFIIDKIESMSDANPEDISDYPINTQPLCAWGEDDESRCDYYDRCDSNWAAPIDNEKQMIQMIQDDMQVEDIADELDTTKDSVRFWINREDWYRYRPD